MAAIEPAGAAVCIRAARLGRWMAGAVNTIGQSKRGGGDRSSRPAQLQARENEQKALPLWIKGATYQQIAAAGFGIASASGAWRSVGRALARIPRQEADQAREAQLVHLQQSVERAQRSDTELTQ